MAVISVDKQIPPKRESSPKVTSVTPPTRQDAVEGIFQMAGLACIMLGQYSDAGAISLHSENISEEIVKIADTDERIARAVDGFMKVGPYAGLIAAVMPLILQIGVNHKMLPVEKLPGVDVVPPELLEARVKTEIAQMQLEVLKAHKEAEEELAKVRAEWEASNSDDNA